MSHSIGDEFHYRSITVHSLYAHECKCFKFEKAHILPGKCSAQKWNIKCTKQLCCCLHSLNTINVNVKNPETNSVASLNRRRNRRFARFLMMHSAQLSEWNLLIIQFRRWRWRSSASQITIYSLTHKLGISRRTNEGVRGREEEISGEINMKFSIWKNRVWWENEQVIGQALELMLCNAFNLKSEWLERERIFINLTLFLHSSRRKLLTDSIIVFVMESEQPKLQFNAGEPHSTECETQLSSESDWISWLSISTSAKAIK